MLVDVPNADSGISRAGNEVERVRAPSQIVHGFGVTSPCFERLPVLFYLGLLLRFLLLRVIICERRLGILFLVAALVHAGLEGCHHGLTPVLPQDDGAFVVCRGKHGAERIPSNAVDWS